MSALLSVALAFESIAFVILILSSYTAFKIGGNTSNEKIIMSTQFIVLICVFIAIVTTAVAAN